MTCVNRLVVSAILTSTCLSAVAGCGTGHEIEDPADESFLPGDKADAFGIEDWSPDGAAVLKYVSNATEAELRSEAGLTARVAKGIVTWRRGADGVAGTSDDRFYEDLQQLDKVRHVGVGVFRRLLAVTKDKGMYRTSLRLPILEAESHNNKGLLEPLAKLNDKMTEQGLDPFGTYFYVDGETAMWDRIDGYNARAEELNERAGTEHGGLYTGMNLNDYANTWGLQPCYIGDPSEVADVVRSLSDSFVSDQYQIYAWRAGEAWWKDPSWDEDEERWNEEVAETWNAYEIGSGEILIEYAIGDDGTDVSFDWLEACRR